MICERIIFWREINFKERKKLGPLLTPEPMFLPLRTSFDIWEKYQIFKKATGYLAFNEETAMQLEKELKARLNSGGRPYRTPEIF